MRSKKLLWMTLGAVLLLNLLVMLSAYAQQPGQKTVRVGWYESPFNITDQYGMRSGYAYEYQRKIAAYTGWNYEYVKGSWPELMDMLLAGEIDLMSDVSYTEKRAESMLFSEFPMGQEDYYLFINKDNTEIRQDAYSTLNGKKVGVYKGSLESSLFREWQRAHGVQAQLVEISASFKESLDMLRRGDIDVYLTTDAFSDSKHFMPVARIGASAFFFAVSKTRPDLLNELNTAMARIAEEDRDYNRYLNAKYNRTSSANLNLIDAEAEWLNRHSTIRVGYLDNFMAYCATDENGALTGALKDYLAAASTCMNTRLVFKAVPYLTAEGALEALKKGDIDCMFPAGLNDYEAETMGLVVSTPVMVSDILAVVRKAEQNSFISKNQVTVAVNRRAPGYELFLKEHFPTWQTEYFKDTEACLAAVAEGKADCLLISNYRYNNIARQCEKLRLTTVSTHLERDYSFAVREGDMGLYSLLARVKRLVPVSVVNAALNYYSTEDAKTDFSYYVRENLVTAVAVIALIAAVVLGLLLRNAKAEKDAENRRDLIAATETDKLTGLYNRSYFTEYANRIYREQPDKKMDAIVLNIDHFHTVNALRGRAFGDQVLKDLVAKGAGRRDPLCPARERGDCRAFGR